MMDVIVEENRNLKQQLEKVSTEQEVLRDELETVKLVEQDTMEENEVLKFQVVELQAKASLGNNKDVSHLAIVTQL